MADTGPVETKNLDRYGYAELPWSRPHDLLAGSSPGADVTRFLGTVGPDGKPHASGIGAVWRHALALWPLTGGSDAADV